MKKMLLLTMLLALLAVPKMFAAPPPTGPEELWLKVKLVDVGSPVYGDKFPEELTFSQPIYTPRDNKVSFRLVMESPIDADVKFEPRYLLRMGDKLKSGITWTIKPMATVFIEGNTQWPVKNYPNGKVMEHWKPHLIRMAPFDLFEVILPESVTSAKLTANKVYAFMVTMNIPENTEKGVYNGDFVLESDGKAQIRLPLTLDVSSVKLPKQFALDSTHWLWPEPENLTSGAIPKYWSEEHWKLLEQAGKILFDDGDNMIYTPIIFAEVPLIQTVKTKDGKYTFDFTGFRRWIKTFDKMGYKYFSGTHMFSWMLPLYVKDEATGERRKIEVDAPEFFDVLNAFMPLLNKELTELGMLERYVQYQRDEPTEKHFEQYKKFAEIRQKYMPKVKSIDAVLDRKGLYENLVDIQVLNIAGAYRMRDKIKAKPEHYWLYSCAYPWPPLPNRHLDSYPVENRFWPLLTVDFGATGFLNWAANIYRGANEYEGSLGPMPNGSRKPGHPPGDNWFLYRGPEGLRTGARMTNYRDGLVDATLLVMLREKNPELADRLVTRVIYPELFKVFQYNYGWLDAAKKVGKTFANSPEQYNILRGEILETLENSEK